jgi:hypothetical protein
MPKRACPCESLKSAVLQDTAAPEPESYRAMFDKSLYKGVQGRYRHPPTAPDGHTVQSSAVHQLPRFGTPESKPPSCLLDSHEPFACLAYGLGLHAGASFVGTVFDLYIRAGGRRGCDPLTRATSARPASLTWEHRAHRV